MENSFRDEKKEVFGLQVDEVAKAHLLETARWTRFLGYGYIVFMVLFVVRMILIAPTVSNLLNYNENSNSAMLASLGIAAIIFVVLLVIGLTVYPIVCMIRYAKYTKAAIYTGNQEEFNLAMRYMKGFFKYSGIMMIIMIGIYGVGFIFAAIGSLV